jgi:type III pantothenate kinase
MSWLLLDAGNTALKWAIISPHAWPWGPDEPAPTQVLARGTHGIDPVQLHAPLQAALGAALARLAGDLPTEVYGCAVASAPALAAIEAACASALQMALGTAAAVQWLTACARFDHDGIVLRNGYRVPEQLGADRWHAQIGARARFPGHALAVINAGTATTVDGIDADGRFLGGVIAPGIDLMRASLAHGTARLPMAMGSFAAHPDNTEDAIRTGILDAQCGLVERRLCRIRERAGGEIITVVCGGHATALLSALLTAPHVRAEPGKVVHEPDLVLRGLWQAGLARSHLAPHPDRRGGVPARTPPA